jgi:hypothetical protein
MTVPSSTRRRRPARRVAAALSVLFMTSGCSDDEAERVDVDEACDRLEELGEVILDAQEATDPKAIESIRPPFDDFVTAADASGDGSLSDLASTAHDAFDTYLTRSGIERREAGNDADIALDRAIARCVELGATNSFPRQP